MGGKSKSLFDAFLPLDRPLSCSCLSAGRSARALPFVFFLSYLLYSSSKYWQFSSMFSFRRKPRKSDADRSGPPFIRNSPSLPELSTQGIPWPENLVDLSSLPQIDTPQSPPQGKPAGHSISSFYTSQPPPPSAFETRKQPVHVRTRLSQRKARSPTTFNIMVVGAQGTGKTSLLRLLLDTADISPTATADQKVAVERFLRGPPKRTDAIQAAEPRAKVGTTSHIHRKVLGCAVRRYAE